MLKRNVIANYVGRFYSMIIGVVVLPIYLKYLGAEAYGLVGFFTMFISWMMLLDMGFSQVLSRETAILKDKVNGLLELKLTLRSVETMIFMFSLIVFIVVLFSSEWIASNWLQIKELSFQTVQKTIELMGFMFILRWYVSLYDSLIIGFEQQVWLNGYKIIMSTIRFIGGLILVIYISNDILYYFLYQTVIAVIEFIILNRKIYVGLPKNNTFLRPSIVSIKKIAPFALGIAYTSGVWIVYTQLDKLLLSHYIPLENYGYFSLVVLVSTAITQFSSPLSQAILPRMTALLSKGKEQDMFALYHKGTQLISIIIFSIVGIIVFFSYELLYAWTGDIKASLWASNILVWYALGNAILAIVAFQYYLQFAYGNLKYHIYFNTYFPLVALPIVFYSVSSYGAIGAGVAWFVIQLITFFIWPPFIHRKFAKGIHLDWMLKDILPIFISTILYLYLIHFFTIDMNMNRGLIFLILILMGLGLVAVNSIVSSIGRKMLINLFKIGVKNA